MTLKKARLQHPHSSTPPSRPHNLEWREVEASKIFSSSSPIVPKKPPIDLPESSLAASRRLSDAQNLTSLHCFHHRSSHGARGDDDMRGQLGVDAKRRLPAVPVPSAGRRRQPHLRRQDAGSDGADQEPAYEEEQQLDNEGLEIGGEVNLTAAIQVAQLGLKHRQNKKQHQRIIVFVGSTVKYEKNVLEAIGKKLKKNNVSLDVVDFGESDNEKPEKLEALVAAVNSGDNSHIVHVPTGETAISDVLISTPIFTGEEGGSGFAAAAAAAATGVSGFEFGVDPNVDPELALALRVSMEEDRARQEAAAKKAAVESSKAENVGESSTSNNDTVMSEAEPVSNTSTEDKRNQLTDDEAQLLQQALALSKEDANSGSARSVDAEMSDGAIYDLDLALALQMSVQEENTGTQSGMSEVFDDQSYVTSILNSLPGVDPNDPSVKDLLASLHGKGEKEKQEKKEDKPEDGK